MHILRTLLDAFYNPRLTCCLCGYEVFDGGMFCGACDKKLVYLKDSGICGQCGRKLPESMPYCAQCKEARVFFDKARSVFSFTGESGRLIYAFKNGGQIYLAKEFAKLLKPLYLTHFFRTDIIAYVPMHPRDLKKRGFNQSQLLAAEISKISGAKVADGALEKTAASAQQKLLTKAERFKNARGVFRVRKRAVFKNKHVLLIDDVFTTGATASAIAEKLKKAGAASVCVLTVFSVSAYRND